MTRWGGAERPKAGRRTGPPFRGGCREAGAADVLSRCRKPGIGGGAPGGAAVRWQGFARLQIIARARLGMGLASPSEWGLANPVQARLRRQSGANAPAAPKGPRKPLAPPGAPFPLLGKGKRDRRCPRRRKTTGRRSVGWLAVIPGPSGAGIHNHGARCETQTEKQRKACGYGFRTRRWRAVPE
jgi:hypothetical protein